MGRVFAGRVSVLFLVLVAVARVSTASPQVPRPVGPYEPIPTGQQIEAKDGDTIVIRGDARVRVVRRGEAHVRAIYNSAQRWLVLLADFVDAQKGAPDGSVDSTYSFLELDGAWPLGERWEGSAILDEYSMAYTPGGSYGIKTEGAFIQLFSGSPAANSRWFGDPRATVISYRGGGRSNTGVPGVPHQTFDQAEEHAIAEATRNAQRGSGGMVTTTPGPGGTALRSSVSMSAPATASPGGVIVGEAPVRVGGTIAQPQKIYDVQPDIPPAAAQAGVRGTVILEIVVGADGAVSSAKVLRSIPMLDQASLDAVRRWRYRPTLVNGQAVPVIMTVTVNFP